MTGADAAREALDRLEKKATPGPWEVVDFTRGVPDADTWLGIIQGAFEILAERFQVGRVKYSSLPPEENHANAALIVAMRNALPDLLAQLTALEAEVAALKNELERPRQ